MDKDFRAVERRFRALRMTESAFITKAGINRVRWWRAKNGKTGADARVTVLREAEDALEQMESPLVCGVCDRRADDPVVRACTDFGCPMAKKPLAA